MPTEPEYGTELATGDIVITKGGESPPDAVGVVIFPGDLVGAPGPPLLVAADGTLGELGPVLRRLVPRPEADLVVVAGRAETSRTREAMLPVLSVAQPTDEAGSALIIQLGILLPKLLGPVDPREAVRRIARLALPGDPDLALTVRRCPYGDIMPCEHTLGGAA